MNPLKVPDGQGSCCVIGCDKQAVNWVGGNTWDDYTEVCQEHTKGSTQEGDTIRPLLGGSDDSLRAATHDAYSNL